MPTWIEVCVRKWLEYLWKYTSFEKYCTTKVGSRSSSENILVIRFVPGYVVLTSKNKHYMWGKWASDGKRQFRSLLDVLPLWHRINNVSPEETLGVLINIESGEKTKRKKRKKKRLAALAVIIQLSSPSSTTGFLQWHFVWVATCGSTCSCNNNSNNIGVCHVCCTCLSACLLDVRWVHCWCVPMSNGKQAGVSVSGNDCTRRTTQPRIKE